MRHRLARPVRALCSIALLVWGGQAGAQVADGADPIQTPFLELETGSHTARIRDLVVDKDGKRLFTIAPDRSLRVWNAADGNLLRTLRLTLGPGTIGDPISIAATPTGETLFVAARSFDRNGSVHDYSIYVVKPLDETAVKARLRLGSLGLGGAARPVSMDLSGFYLALALGPDGVLIVDARTLKQTTVPMRDRIAGAAVTQVAFGAGNRLAVATSTGLLRLYQVDERTGLTLLAERYLDAAGDMHRIAFSPDGRFLAVGFRGSDRVALFAADGLRPMRSFPAPPDLRGNLAVVAILPGANGALWLAAGGTAQDRQRRNLILLWPLDGGRPLRIAAGSDSITALAALGEGRLAVATSRPEHALVRLPQRPGQAATLDYLHSAQTFDFRASASAGLRISRDGTQVLAQTNDGQAIGFDLKGLRPLYDQDEMQRDSRQSQAMLDGRGFADWREKTAPRLFGYALVGRDGQSMLRQNERALSVDLVGPDTPAVVGADFHLYLVNRDGFETASARTRAAVWGVASTSDGRTIAAALGDGTIRWYRPTGTGLQEVAAVFLHPDGQRWVAWQPDGRFAHSDFGGAELTGFHVNGSGMPPQGQWIQMGAFYTVHYAPGDVAEALTAENIVGPDYARFAALVERPQIKPVSYCSTRTDNVAWTTRSLMEDEELAVSAPVEPACRDVDAQALGLAADGPAGRGVPLAFDRDALEVTLEIAAGAGGIDRVEAMLNGRLVGVFELSPKQRSAARLGPLRLRAEVPLDVGENRLVFRAYNQAGVYRQSAALYLRSEADPGAVDPATLYLLGVGIDDYRDGVGDLAYAGQDAMTVISRIGAAASAAYDVVRDPIILRDAAAGRAAILDQIAQIAAQVDHNDAVVIYLAGHGIADDLGYVFATHDVPGLAPGAVRAHGLTAKALAQALGDLRAANVLIVLDTCYAGGFEVAGPDRLSHQTGRYVITSTAATDEALDHARGTQNGVFAAAMLEALSGQAAIAGMVDVLTLASYVLRRVGEIAADMRHGQAAVFKSAIGEQRPFPLAVL
ncbi:MAG: caspase family protein [Pseudomonadota bacterium]